MSEGVKWKLEMIARSLKKGLRREDEGVCVLNDQHASRFCDLVYKRPIGLNIHRIIGILLQTSSHRLHHHCRGVTTDDQERCHLLTLDYAPILDHAALDIVRRERGFVVR